MRAWQSYQEGSDARVLVQHRHHQYAIGGIPGPPAMGVVLRNSEIDHPCVLLGPRLELLDQAACQRTTRVQDASTGTQQQYHLLRRLVEMECRGCLAIQHGL